MKSSALLLLAGAATEATAFKVPLHPVAHDANNAPSVHRAAARLRMHAKRAAASSSGVTVPLSDWIGTVDLQWYGTVSVGTPPQNLSVLFDTGSSTLLIPAAQCDSCVSAHRYNKTASSSTGTVANAAPRYNVSFDTGGTNIPAKSTSNSFVGVSGTLGTDVVTFPLSSDASDLTVEKQAFLMLDDVTAGFDLGPIDGILGLPPASVGHELTSVGGSKSSITEDPTPYLFQLNATGKLAEGVIFTLVLDEGNNATGQGGHLTLGSVDTSLVKGGTDGLTYADWIDEFASIGAGWAVNQSGFDILLTTSSGSSSSYADTSAAFAILDSGTAFIQAPDNTTAANIYSAISTDIVPIDTVGSWGAKCSVFEALAATGTELTITWHFGKGINATLPAANLNQGAYPSLDGICQAAILSPAAPFDFGAPTWLFGSPLLKQYVTVWDAEKGRVGFGDFATPTSTGEGSSSGSSSGSGNGSSSGSDSGGSATTSSSTTKATNAAGVARPLSIGNVVALFVALLVIAM